MIACLGANGCDDRLIVIGLLDRDLAIDNRPNILDDGGITGMHAKPGCADGRRNGDETDVDCGGSCAACEFGGACLVDGDCRNARCVAGRCVASKLGSFAFGTRTDVAISTTPDALLLGDFNRDGARDVGLAAGSARSYQTAVLPGRGDGTLAPERVSPTAYVVPGRVTTGDFDEDGRLDVAVASTGSQLVFTHAGRGDGTFRLLDFSSSTYPGAIAAADFDGDGHLDLAVTSLSVSGARSGVTIFRGRGDGRFVAAGYTDLCVGPIAIAAGNLDGDGEVDLAVACNGTAFTGGASDAGVIGDLGVSHPSDLASFGSSDLQAVTDGGAAAVDFGVTADLATFSDLASFADQGASVTDLGAPVSDGPIDDAMVSDGMAMMDAVAITDAPSTNMDASVIGPTDVYVLHGRGDSTWRSISRLGIGSACSLAIADFDGDGRDDLAAGSCERDEVFLARQPGDGTLDITWTGFVGPAPVALAAADFDGDGRFDLAVANSGTGSVTVLAGRVGGSFQQGAMLTAIPGSIVDVRAGDLDGDGRPDLTVARHGPDGVSVLLAK